MEIADNNNELTFCDLRKNLPSTSSNDKLSVPISFVALLHLCNEKVFFINEMKFPCQILIIFFFLI